MSLNNFIENLREKPEHIKKRFAFLVSFSFSFILFAGWMISVNQNTSQIIVKKLPDGNTVETPVSTLTANVIGAYQDIKNIFRSSNKVEYVSSDFLEVKAGDR